MKSLNFTKEYMFHTLQGEGKFTGFPSVFLRLSGCNLRCEWQNDDGSTTKCDTPYSSYEPDKNIKSMDQVLSDLNQYNCQHIVITGGEPFLQNTVVDLVDALVDLKKFITIETNASIYLPTKAQFISMSPKLSSSSVIGNKFFSKHQEKRLSIESIDQFIAEHDYQLKFVINCVDDLDEVMQLLKKLRQYSPEKIYLMPQGDEISQLQQKENWLVEMCKKTGFNFCSRQHILLNIK